MIYLDYAATTPMSKEALLAYKEGAKNYYGNSSSLHDIGTNANGVLEKCRTSWAKLLNAEPQGVYFTSGGTEANQLAIQSIIKGNRHKGNHIITTEAEHSSLDNLFKQLVKEGYDITFLPLDKNGQVDLEEAEKAIRHETILASIHHGNGEVGFIQPLEKLGEIFARHNIVFHADCVQTFGHEEVNVKRAKLDALSISSHKIYGPKGTGLCYINPRVYWEGLIENSSHEGGFRPGTVDVPSIIAFTVAGQKMMEARETNKNRCYQLRNYFVKKLQNSLPDVKIIESTEDQLQQIIGLLFPKLQGQYIMVECNKSGIAISTGSACQVGMQHPSRTLLSIGKTADEAKQLIRISIGKMTNENELDQCVYVFNRIMNGI